MDFPTGPDELSAGWLTTALRAGGAIRRASVVTFTTTALTVEKGITGVLTLVALGYDQPEPGAPATLVVKFSAAHPDLRAVLHEMRFFEREVRFYADLAEATPIRTPRCYAAEIDRDSGWSVLLLEDLSALRNGSWVGGSSLEDLRLALTGIAAVHAAWWESPVLAEHAWLGLASLTSVPQMQQVAVDTWPGFLRRLSAPASREILAAGELIRRHLHAVGAYLLETPPRTLVHHDFDGDNLFFAAAAGHPALTVIDWQLTTRAHPAVDVAWLVAGQCEPPERRAHEQHLVRDYHALLVGHGVTDYSFAQCWEDYRLALLLAAARVCSSVGFQPGPPGGFWDVVFPRYAQALADLQVGELLEARHPVRV